MFPQAEIRQDSTPGLQISFSFSKITFSVKGPCLNFEVEESIIFEKHFQKFSFSIS